jgi:hypothetical protein
MTKYLVSLSRTENPSGERSRSSSLGSPVNARDPLLTQVLKDLLRSQVLCLLHELHDLPDPAQDGGIVPVAQHHPEPPDADCPPPLIGRDREGLRDGGRDVGKLGEDVDDISKRCTDCTQASFQKRLVGMLNHVSVLSSS